MMPRDGLSVALSVAVATVLIQSAIAASAVGAFSEPRLVERVTNGIPARDTYVVGQASETSEQSAEKVNAPSIAETPGTPSVRTGKPTYAPNEPVVVHFENAPTDHGKAWVTITPAESSMRTYHAWQYLRGQRSGQVTLRNRHKAGRYEARLFSRDYNLIAKSDFTIGAPPEAFERSGPPSIRTAKTTYASNEPVVIQFENAPTDHARAWVNIAPAGSAVRTYRVYEYLSGRPAGEVTLPNDHRPGRYEARLFSMGYKLIAKSDFTIYAAPGTAEKFRTAAIRTSKTTYARNEPVVVSYENLPSDQDSIWITIVPAGTKRAVSMIAAGVPRGAGKVWKRLGPDGSGEVTLPFSSGEGDYEVHVYTLRYNQSSLVAKAEFDVEVPAAEKYGVSVAANQDKSEQAPAKSTKRELSAAEKEQSAKCAVLAGAPFEPGIDDRSVPFRAIKPKRAIAVCRRVHDAVPYFAPAAFRLGRALHAAGDFEAALKYYRIAADKGYGSAMANLGHMYREGQGVTQNYEKAASWYRKAIRKGNPVAAIAIARLYETGAGALEQDESRAAIFYRKAVAIYRYPKDVGTVIDAVQNFESIYTKLPMPKEPVALLEQAAKDGRARAQTSLGILYENGWGVSRDRDRAMTLYQEALRNGGVGARAKIARMEKVNEELRQYEAAARSNDVKAQLHLGSLYEDGRIVAQDYKQAGHWYEMAAKQGNAQAQFRLGVLYLSERIGLYGHRERGLALLQQSAQQGHAEAKKWLQGEQRRAREMREWKEELRAERERERRAAAARRNAPQRDYFSNPIVPWDDVFSQ